MQCRCADTKEIDYGLWHTPRVTMIEESLEGFQNRMNSKRSKDRGEHATPNLAVQALWATPNTMDCLPPRSMEAMQRQFNTTRKGRTAPANLREQVHSAMWPAPQASDSRDRGRWENPCIQKRIAAGKQINLSMLSQGCGLIAQTESKGSLNPQFVCWLMGYPQEHLNCAPTVTPLSRRLRRNSLKQALKQ